MTDVNKKTDQLPKKTPLSRSARDSITIAVLIVASIILTMALLAVNPVREGIFSYKNEKKDAKFIPPKEGTWRFIVSGDSRNCGDVVMPAIAAHSLERYQPSFYWHLGDLRAIYKVDEDMAYAEIANGHYLVCENYVKRAWPDFIEHEIAPFGSTPFYLGIGNHEVIPPKGYSKEIPESVQPRINSAKFTAQFADWLMSPAIKEQRLKDKDCDNPPATSSAKPGQSTSATQECLVLPRNYYHWIQRGVDFIYLDNASNVFGGDQIKWLQDRLDSARKNDDVRSIVVGMHEALPKSISSDHAMCDDTKKSDKNYPLSCKDGEDVYQALLRFQEARPAKPVYVLASHSHFYMQGIFNARPEPERLPGWIVGTAGAVRYELPKDKTAKPDDARTNVYGYLLATVDQNGKIDFKFQEVKEADVPSRTQQQYPATLVNWCFAHNSQDIDPHAPETTANCLPPREPPAPTPAK
jgi:hypothetical protein